MPRQSLVECDEMSGYFGHRFDAYIQSWRTVSRLEKCVSFDRYLRSNEIWYSDNSSAQVRRSTLKINTFVFTPCMTVPAVGTAEAGLPGCAAKIAGDNKEGQRHGKRWHLGRMVPETKWFTGEHVVRTEVNEKWKSFTLTCGP
jgi:hypothetical protein